MTSLAIARLEASKAAIEPAARPFYYIIAAIWALLLPVGYASKLTIDPDFLVLLIPVQAMLAVIGLLKRRGQLALATMIECNVALAVAAFSFVLLSLLLARSNAPYVDPLLDAVEQWLFPGFDWAGTMIAFCSLDLPLRLANFAYDSLWWQGILLVALLCATGRRARCWDYALAWAISLSITLAIFACAPALDAYAYHHIPHSMVSGVLNDGAWRSPVVLERLRSPGWVTIRPQDMTGVVEFPSFHTASAVLLMWGFWPLRWTRPIAVTLNVGVILSSIPIGAHYLPSVPAGVITAVAGIRAMCVWRKLELSGFRRESAAVGLSAEAPLGASS